MYFPAEPAPVVADYLDKARKGAQGKKGIIFLQLDSRGSNYVYPHMQALAKGLIKEGYFVMSVTKGGPVENPDYLEIDIKKLSINQTWHLLSILKGEFPLYVIAVNSVFWAASAGLHLPNLGLQHWIDKKVHNLWYPNIVFPDDSVSFKSSADDERLELGKVRCHNVKLSVMMSDADRKDSFVRLGIAQVSLRRFSCHSRKVLPVDKVSAFGN